MRCRLRSNRVPKGSYIVFVRTVEAGVPRNARRRVLGVHVAAGPYKQNGKAPDRLRIDLNAKNTAEAVF